MTPEEYMPFLHMLHVGQCIVSGKQAPTRLALASVRHVQSVRSLTLSFHRMLQLHLFALLAVHLQNLPLVRLCAR